MSLVIGICVGFVFGILVTLCVLRKGAIGNLIIIHDSEDGPYIFLEISKTEIETLRVKPTVKLNVVNRGRTHK